MTWVPRAVRGRTLSGPPGCRPSILSSLRIHGNGCPRHPFLDVASEKDVVTPGPSTARNIPQGFGIRRSESAPGGSRCLPITRGRSASCCAWTRQHATGPRRLRDPPSVFPSGPSGRRQTAAVIPGVRGLPRRVVAIPRRTRPRAAGCAASQNPPASCRRIRVRDIKDPSVPGIGGARQGTLRPRGRREDTATARARRGRRRRSCPRRARPASPIGKRQNGLGSSAGK